MEYTLDIKARYNMQHGNIPAVIVTDGDWEYTLYWDGKYLIKNKPEEENGKYFAYDMKQDLYDKLVDKYEEILDKAYAEHGGRNVK